MSFNIEFNEQQAASADRAGRIDTSGAYIGKITSAYAIKSKNTGTDGITFAFESPSDGSADFTLYIRKENGDDVFGMNLVQAMMSIFGIRGLRSVEGKYKKYDYDAKADVETSGEIFPDLMGKNIGLVLQKEKYSKETGGEGWRMNLAGVFHAETRLTASEIRDKKITPAKLDKMLRGLKDKDSRTVKTDAPQPSVGASGDY